MAGPVLFIVGPTASGKTAAALALAKRLPVEIVNADSRQVYRGMSVGTAKPSPADLAAVPHHLIDVAAPDEPYSLARFLAEARRAVAEIAERGAVAEIAERGAVAEIAERGAVAEIAERGAVAEIAERGAVAEIAERGAVPVVVGGTGQYVWGLAEGWQAPAVPPDAAYRADLEEEARRRGADALHRRLRDADPDAADAIDPRNVRRVIRALEVRRASGEPLSRRRRKVAPDFAPLMLGLAPEREALRERADTRVDAMLRGGWIEEVRELLRNGYGPELPSFSALGYREVAACVRGELTLEETASLVKTAAHRLIRRQRTWFKPSDARIVWSADGDALVERALALLRH